MDIYGYDAYAYDSAVKIYEDVSVLDAKAIIKSFNNSMRDAAFN